MDQITMILQVFAPFVALFISAPFIQALVNMAKASGLKNEYAPWLAISIGGILGAATSFLVVNLVAVPFSWVIVYIVGIYLGLKEGASAAGFYDAAKTILNKPAEASNIITDESGSAQGLVAIMTIAFVGLFVYVLCLVIPQYYIYYIVASCAFIGYMLGALSNFNYIKKLEKTLINGRMNTL